MKIKARSLAAIGAAAFSGFITALLVTSAVLMPARAAQEARTTASIPNFSGMMTGWMAMSQVDFYPVPDGPPLVINDPAYPRTFGFAQGVQESDPVADLNNSNLTEFAKESLRRANERVLQGKTLFAREARCWPTGVPTFLLNRSGNPIYFIQTPREVVIIWPTDHQVRHVYLDVPHSKNPKPSWYGESVGRYEGETLVVDTIGQNTKTFVDNYRTPHSEKLHVIERFYLVNDGKYLEADVVVEDPATFKEPVQVRQYWERVDEGPMTESSCAETGGGYFSFEVEPVPTAEKPDF